ncbi:MAG: DUF4239 domain-containing protein [Candidatus Omnitrophica bacterium]|nr:DUF4239 domain-containing protein [Candidatus Omnitrophota bacterium]
MSITHALLFYIPSWLLGLLIVGGMTVFSVIGLMFVRRIVPHHKLRVHHDVAGPIFCTLGVIYAVLITFVTVMVWGQFDKARHDVEEEASCLMSLYRASDAFQQDFKIKVRSDIANYAKAVLEEEWGCLAKGNGCPSVDLLLKNLWTSYTRHLPNPGIEEIFFNESITRLEQLERYRTMRIVDSKTSLPGLMWAILFIGGMATISFTFFFGVENFKAQAIMASLLVIIIGLMLFAILCMDYPFTGSVSITPEPFKQIERMSLI